MNVVSLRQQQKQKTRESILQTAIQVFRTDGFLNGKTEEIARAAGVAHGTIFVHFPKREDLLVGAVNAVAGVAADETRKSLRTAHSVAGVLTAHVAAIRRDEEIFVHLARESFALPDRARAAVVEINSAVSTHLAEVIGKGTTKAHGLSHAFIFNMWMGLLNHYLQNRDLFAPGGKVLEKHGDDLVTNFVKALNLK